MGVVFCTPSPYSYTMSQTTPIKDWHIVIGGFLQTRKTCTGMTTLWKKLYTCTVSPSCVVELASWNDDFSAIAEHINRISVNPHIRIYGYSWGGAGACVLAEELRKRGLQVEYMVLSDPVVRHRYWFGQWRAFVPFIPLQIPDNVRYVSWFRQYQTLHYGHDLVGRGTKTGRTKIFSPKILHYPHTWMDNAIEFHDRCLKVASG